ncbi:MAG: hypothetical protein J6V41_01355 [Kiritimatiellae bacterium]|nr:hypothetical protein [Kiritimatiellia bacterium]
MIVNEPIYKTLIPKDCSGDTNKHFYSFDSQQDIINRLLMNGTYTEGGIDLSYGKVYGIWYHWKDGIKVYYKSLSEIGFDEIGIRNLSIYGGNN